MALGTLDYTDHSLVLDSFARLPGSFLVVSSVGSLVGPA